MAYEAMPIFDEARVVDELDGDRELLFEIVRLYRSKISSAVDRLEDLPFGSPRAQPVAAEIAQAAGRIHACRLEWTARSIVELDPQPGPLVEGVGTLIDEARQFLRETRIVI